MKPLLNISDVKLMEILNRVPFFKAMSAQERKMLTCKEISFFASTKGDFIIKQGARDSDFYILLSGTADVVKGSKRSNILAQLIPGDFVGEVAFITNQPRTATVIATDQCILLRIDQRSMRRLPAPLRDKIKDTIIGRLIGRIDNLNTQVVDLQDQVTKVSSLCEIAENRLKTAMTPLEDEGLPTKVYKGSTTA